MDFSSRCVPGGLLQENLAKAGLFGVPLSLHSCIRFAHFGTASPHLQSLPRCGCFNFSREDAFCCGKAAALGAAAEGCSGAQRRNDRRGTADIATANF